MKFTATTVASNGNIEIRFSESGAPELFVNGNSHGYLSEAPKDLRSFAEGFFAALDRVGGYPTISSSEHTPGPWTCDMTVSECDGHSAMIIETEAPTHPTVAAAFCRDTDDETTANARIIAAAPQLLVACRSASLTYDDRLSLLEDEREWRPNDEYEDMKEHYTLLKKDVDAVLAKAQGTTR